MKGPGRTCESCGMLMLDLADFAAKNAHARYCKYCTSADGMLQGVDERKRLLTEFLMEEEKIPRDKAEKTAVERMRKMPAWKGRV